MTELQDSETAATTRPTTVAGLVLRAVREHDGTALHSKRDGAWVDVSYPELGRTARSLAKGLVALGIEPRERVAILAATRPEWTYADCAGLLAAATVVPVYQTASPEECAYVLAHSESRLVYCEDAAQVAKVTSVRAECPALEHIVVLVGEAPGAMTLAELAERGAHVTDETLEARARELGPDDICTLIYTSGTTGPPKGCILTHANVLAAVSMFEQRAALDEQVVFFAFLPLAHSFTRVLEIVALDIGATIAYWEGDSKRLLANVAEAAPTHFPSVPRIFEKLHAAALGRMEDGSRAQATAFHAALAIGRRKAAIERQGRVPRPLLRAAHALADRAILSRIRLLFGPRLQMAVSGAAPIAPDILEFFAACGVAVYEGYGMTETMAAGTLNAPGAVRIGSVGRPLPGCEVRIAADGEVLMRGPQVFQGYFRDAAATTDTLIDGWLHSGDLGSLDADGFLRITGRKKELIITSSGKNISPSNMEEALKECRWIGNAVVIGDNRPYLVALIALDPDEAPKLAERLGLDDADPAAMAQDERVRAAIAEHVDAINERFARIEQVKKFVLLERDLTLADGELTPTMKVKRAVVHDRYAEAIDDLYEPRPDA